MDSTKNAWPRVRHLGRTGQPRAPTSPFAWLRLIRASGVYARAVDPAPSRVIAVIPGLRSLCTTHHFYSMSVKHLIESQINQSDRNGGPFTGRLVCHRCHC